MTGDQHQRLIRVASYNVHACVGTDGFFAPARIADVVAALEADVIALQEVEDREHRGMTVSRYLADVLGLYVAGRTTHRRVGLDYGNLLLSRTPPLHTTSIDLAVPNREPRAAIEADFVVARHSLRVMATHFGLSAKERRVQLQRILPRLQSPEADLTVLCADFNEWLPNSGLHRALRRTLGATPTVRTFPSRLATLSLDRIYATPVAALVSLKVVATATARQASDHLPVVAEFDPGRIGKPASN